MNNKTIKPKLEMNLRSVVGGFNPFEKIMISQTSSHSVYLQRFNERPNKRIFWGCTSRDNLAYSLGNTHATSDESSGVLVQYLLAGPLAHHAR